MRGKIGYLHAERIKGDLKRDQVTFDGEPILVSAPPKGKCLVTNLYVDPDTGKLILEYEDTPQE